MTGLVKRCEWCGTWWRSDLYDHSLECGRTQRVRAEAAERLAAERLDLLADCLEQIGLRDERGFLDGHNSDAEDLIDHLAAAGRLVRVVGDGTARWEWVEVK